MNKIDGNQKVELMRIGGAKDREVKTKSDKWSRRRDNSYLS